MSSDAATPRDVTPAAIKQFRILREWSQADLAKALEGHWPSMSGQMDRPTITRLESGERRINVEEVMALADALGVGPLSLILPREERGSEAGDPAPLQITPEGPIVDNPFRLWTWARGMLPLGDLDNEQANLVFDRARPAFERRASGTFPEVLEIQQLAGLAVRSAADGKFADVMRILQTLLETVQHAIDVTSAREAAENNRTIQGLRDLIRELEPERPQQTPVEGSDTTGQKRGSRPSPRRGSKEWWADDANQQRRGADSADLSAVTPANEESTSGQSR
jgi:transcriptional regulator with XRE-family HTH domain